MPQKLLNNNLINLTTDQIKDIIISTYLGGIRDDTYLLLALLKTKIQSMKNNTTELFHVLLNILGPYDELNSYFYIRSLQSLNKGITMLDTLVLIQENYIYVNQN
jgi:hypothetical protein